MRHDRQALPGSQLVGVTPLSRRSSSAAAIAWGVLHKVPNGYCPHHSTGVGCPAWGAGLVPQESAVSTQVLLLDSAAALLKEGTGVDAVEVATHESRDAVVIDAMRVSMSTAAIEVLAKRVEEVTEDEFQV